MLVGGSFVYARVCWGGHAFNMHQLSLVSDHIYVTCDTYRTEEAKRKKKRVTGREKRNGGIVKWLQFKTLRPSAGADW